MFERYFSPVLAFMLLAGGTFAIGSELFAPAGRPASTQTMMVQLPQVEVIGHRVPVQVAATEAAPTRLQ